MGKVLVLDDQPDVRQLLGRIIEKSGHSALRAETADREPGRRKNPIKKGRVEYITLFSSFVF